MPSPPNTARLDTLALEDLGERYARFRLPHPQAEAAMEASLRRYGQISAVAVCERDEQVEVLDGFKRVAAARRIETIASLSVRYLDVDERHAKASIAALNLVGGRLHELEEARIVHSLVREDGLSQVEVAELLGRHKSWVCRRLSLIERLSPRVQEDVEVGLLTASVARELVRLPAGNQDALLVTMRQEALSRDEVREVARLLESAADAEACRFVLEQPREALQQEKSEGRRTRNPRLSLAGNRFLRSLSVLLDVTPRVENVLRSHSVVGLTRMDLRVLEGDLARLERESASLSETVCHALEEVRADG